MPVKYTRKKKLSRRQREKLPPEQRRPPGRPPGIHTKHKTPQERRMYLVERYGCPVEFMLMTMANVREKKGIRLEQAKNAAPYVMPKMAQNEILGDPDKPLHVKQDLSNLSDSELAALYRERVGKKK